MTRKDFKAIAGTIAQIKSPAARAAEVARYIPILKASNPRFDAARFIAACNVKGAPIMTD